MSERRAFDRQLSCIPAAFETRGDQQDLALIRDVSAAGARLLTRVSLEVDDVVSLQLYLGTESEPPRKATGRVVRVDRRDPELSDVWRWDVGVEFDVAITPYEAEIAALRKRQEAAGLLKP